jgi:hypothetical protein
MATARRVDVGQDPGNQQSSREYLRRARQAGGENAGRTIAWEAAIARPDSDGPYDAVIRPVPKPKCAGGRRASR